MTQGPRAPEERQGRPAVDTRHTAATTAANKVRIHFFHFPTYLRAHASEEVKNKMFIKSATIYQGHIKSSPDGGL